jgi:hypothetical protein
VLILQILLWFPREGASESKICCLEFLYFEVGNPNGEPWWNDTDGKTEDLREKPDPVPLYLPQISHGLKQA